MRVILSAVRLGYATALKDYRRRAMKRLPSAAYEVFVPRKMVDALLPQMGIVEGRLFARRRICVGPAVVSVCDRLRVPDAVG